MIDNYSMTKASTAPSGSISTVTSSAATGSPSNTTTTAGSSSEVAEASASKNDETKPGILAGVGFNKSGSVLRTRIEEGHSN